MEPKERALIADLEKLRDDESTSDAIAVLISDAIDRIEHLESELNVKEYALEEEESKSGSLTEELKVYTDAENLAKDEAIRQRILSELQS